MSFSSRAITCGLLALLSTSVGSLAQPPQSTTYTIRVPEYDKRIVEVDAHVVLADSVLLMYPEGANHVPHGWATYVRGLTASDDSGRVVSLRSVGPGQWVVPAPRPNAVNLRYEVLIHHDAGRWPFGSKEAAFARPDCVFLTGKALFIAQFLTADARVRVILPNGWDIATPWAEVTDEHPAPVSDTALTAGYTSRSYAVRDVYELLEVGMLVGRHLQRTVTLGDVGITLAVGQDLATALPLFESATRRLVPAAVAVFDGVPSGKFVFIANRDVYDGGTSFTRSMNMVFKDTPTATNRGDWAHILTHEFLHLWNGNAIRTADGTQEYWFSEGVTDYLANILERRIGMIEERQLLDRLSGHYQKYLDAGAAAPGVSLRVAGEEKAKRYDLVYSGGVLAALALDIEMRKGGGERGIEDLLRAMYAEFGITRKPYEADDVRRLASAVAGHDLGAFFTRFVHGTEVLPMTGYFRDLGLVVTTRPTTASGATRTSYRLVRRTDASPKQRALASRILGSPR
jgi:predicted metalloprotease with PDZ domain